MRNGFGFQLLYTALFVLAVYIVLMIVFAALVQ
jgi:hypothetical protein